MTWNPTTSPLLLAKSFHGLRNHYGSVYDRVRWSELQTHIEDAIVEIKRLEAELDELKDEIQQSNWDRDLEQ